MALFEVPGWSMPGSVRPASTSNPRKRKRPNAGGGAEKLQSAEVNVEKLMKQLDSATSRSDTVQQSEKKQKRGNDLKVRAGAKTSLKSGRKGKAWEAKGDRSKSNPQSRATTPRNVSSTAGVGSKPKKGKHRDEPSMSVSKEGDSQATLLTDISAKVQPPSNSKKTKKDEKKRAKEISLAPRKEMQDQAVDNENSGDKKLTSLQAKMKQSLDGARFRWINETLYKTGSKDAERMMREDPKMFDDYHAGFRHQVTAWPTNPVDLFKESIASTYPPKSVIVDLGCGDAALARALIPKGYVVLSYDLISRNPFVISTDICDTLPLPGAEDEVESDGSSSQVVDVVVCSLSLMSTNWLNGIREVRRILKSGGELKIAEVASRFTDVDSFTSVISSVGFKLVSKDERNTHFALFDFKKIRRRQLEEKEWQTIVSRGSVLQPCEYKKR